MSRKIISMNKGWKFHRGDAAGDEKLHIAGVRSTNAGILSGPAGKNYGDANWRDIDLPHDYVNEGPFGAEYDMMHGYRERPNAWYRKSFCLDESYKDKQLMLCFEGINVHCEIYFNGSLIERSFNGFQEIWVDITPRAYTDGRPNVLAVYVKSNPVQLWSYEGGGIYRNVWLYAKDHLHIARDGIYVNPTLLSEAEKLWRVDLQAEIENSSYSPLSGEVFVKFSKDGKEIYSAKMGDVAAEAGRIITLNHSFELSDPLLWDIGSPNLYDVEFTVLKDGCEVDTQSCRTGFRWFSVDCNKGFFLNGKNVKIKGVCCHQDHACVGIAVSEKVNRYRISQIKKMGANAYRCAHHMMDRSVYDICDEMGIIVMDENRFFETRPDNLEALKNQIRRNRNHPSIIFWSLFNEEPLQNTDEGAKIYKKLRATAEMFDRSRLFTGGMNGYGLDGAGLEMDISGKNYGLRQLEGLHRDYPNQPIIGSENMAAWANRGELVSNPEKCLCGGYDLESFDWSHTAQQMWEVTHDMDWYAGTFIWAGFDYRGEPQPYAWPAICTPHGMMDMCGFEKSEFYFAKAVYDEKPFVKVVPHWNHAEGEIIRVVAVGNCEEAELLLNGKSLGRKPGNIGNQPAWEVPFEAGELVALGYCGGKPIAEDRVITTGDAERIVVESSMGAVKNDGFDNLILKVAVTDKDGNLVNSAENLLNFEIEGDGYLLGIGNGCPTCHELDSNPAHSIFHGLCQAIIAVKEGAKSLKVKVSGEGLESAVYEANILEESSAEFMPSAPNYNISGFTMSEIYSSPIDPNMEIGDNDVNTFMPLDIPLKNHQGDFKGGWRLYRTVFDLPEIQGNSGLYTIEIGDAHCQAISVYINGKKVHEEADEKWAFSKAVRFSFDGEAGETVEMRLLMHYPFTDRSGGISKYVKFITE